MDITTLSGTLNAPVNTAQAIPPQQAAENRSIIQAVKAVNSTEMMGEDNHLAFSRDPASQRMVIQVINRVTHEVVSQIPPEYVLALAEDLRRQQAEAAAAKCK